MLDLANQLVRRNYNNIDATLNQLMDLHRVMGNRGYQDQIVRVLVEGLVAKGDSAGASELLTDYVISSRREIRPLPPELQRLVLLLNKETARNQGSLTTSR